MNKRIGSMNIDLVTREISARYEDGTPIVFPLSSSGGTIMRWTKSSTGGLCIQAVTRELEDLLNEGGNVL